MELFDIRTPDGEVTEQAKERSAVHRDGDWHGRPISGWFVDKNGRLQVLLQKRSRKRKPFRDALIPPARAIFPPGTALRREPCGSFRGAGHSGRGAGSFYVGLYSYEVNENFGGTDIIDREIAAVYLYQKPVEFRSSACRKRRWRRFAGWTSKN